MDKKDLKCIVGKAKTGEPAMIRFYGSVNSCSVDFFNDEFLWLQDYVKPSKIVVLINSEGGDVISGMSAFSVINSCPIEVDCIVEGIAASMGSIIWAAGDNLYMHDYSILMIHNPYSECATDDATAKAAVESFKKQLSTIYIKRFGLSEDKVKAIMDGEDDVDGTFFTAEDAVNAGIIDDSHIIATSEGVRSQVRSELEGVTKEKDIREKMSIISAKLDENKLLKNMKAICKQNEQTHFIKESDKMEQKQNFDTISAQLGLKDVQIEGVSARIAELLAAEAKLKEVTDSLTQAEIKLQGKDAELANVNSELESANAQLKKYQDAEAAAFEAAIENTVDAAIKDGKIEEASRESWIKMAHADLETVKTTLSSIQPRAEINKQIANDEGNKQEIEKALEDVEAEMAKKVKEVCGEIQFRKF